MAAPSLLVGYGLLRIVDGLADGHGPGVWWTASHALFLASLLLFCVVLVGLGRRVRGRWIRWAALIVTVVAVAGLVVAVRTVVIDLIVGLVATSRTEMERHFEAFGSVVPLPGIVSDAAPAVFFAGVTTLLLLLVLQRPALVPWWSPVLSLGTAFGQVSPWLAPIGAMMLLVALLAVSRTCKRCDAIREAP